MRKPDTHPGGRQPGPAGHGGKAAERLKMFHEARGISEDPVERSAWDYSAAVLQAITAAQAAGPGTPGLTWRFLGPDLIPNGQTRVPSSRVPVSGRVSAIAIDPANRNHLLCGAAAGGIWESFTRGADWAPRTDFMPTLTTGAIAFDPRNPAIVYAGTGEGNQYWYFGQGILKSADGGTTWTPLTSKPFTGQGFFAIIIDPANTQHILAATQGLPAFTTPAAGSTPAATTPATGGVWESADGGATWTQVYAARACWDLSMQPGGGPAAEVLAAVPDGLLRSADGGHTWAAQPLPGAPGSWTRLAVSISPKDPTVAFAFGASRETGLPAYLWRRGAGAWSAIPTPPAGATPTGVNTGLETDQADYDWYVAAAPDRADGVYLGAKDVHRGDLAADGTTWRWANLSTKDPGDCIHADQHAIAFDPAEPATIYCAGDGGVFRSPNAGYSWVSLNAGLGITEIEYMVHDNASSRWLLAGTQDNGTLRYLGTSALEHAADGDGGDCGIDQTRTDPAKPATCYYTYVQMVIGRSTAGGARGTFTRISPPGTQPPGTYQTLFYPPVGVSGSTVAIAGESVFVSRDTGTTWTEVKLPWADYGTLREDQYTTALWLPSSDLVYAATKKGRIFKITYSSSSGAWSGPVQLTRPRRAYVSAIRASAVPGSPDRIWVTMSRVGDGTVNDGQVFRSDDGGTTWTDKTGYSTDTTKNLPPLPLTSIAFDNTNPDRVWVSADVGVYQSPDGGTTWTPFFQNLPYVIVEDLEFHPVARVLRAGTRSRGIWEVTVDPPGSSMAPSVKACSVQWNHSGGLQVFTAGPGNAPQSIYQNAPHTGWEPITGWGGWMPMGTGRETGSSTSTGTTPNQIITSPLTVAAYQDGRLDAFGRGPDGGLWHSSTIPPDYGWAGWIALGGLVTSNLAVAAGQDGQLHVFVRGRDGKLWEREQDTSGNVGAESGWRSWGARGSKVITSAPAAALNSGGLVEVFARGIDGGLMRIRLTARGSGVASEWESLGGILAGNPVVQRGQDGHLEVFARGPEGALWHLYETAPGGSWSAWESLGGTFIGDPAVTSNRDRGLQAFVRWTDNGLRDIWQAGPYGSWSAWNPLPGTPALSSDPAATSDQDGWMNVFARGTDNTLWQCHQSAADWQWASLGGVLLGFP